MSEPSNKPDHEDGLCPHCRKPGQVVSAVTVAAMLSPESSRRLASTAGFRFCTTQDCAVAYFDPASGELVLQRDVRVPIFQKSTDPHRLVCYCFGHTARAVQAEIRAKALSSILDDIKSGCAQGLDACESNNPQGSCCLGNVQRLIREAGSSTVPPEEGGCCGCGGD